MHDKSLFNILHCHTDILECQTESFWNTNCIKEYTTHAFRYGTCSKYLFASFEEMSWQGKISGHSPFLCSIVLLCCMYGSKQKATDFPFTMWLEIALLPLPRLALLDFSQYFNYLKSAFHIWDLEKQDNHLLFFQLKPELQFIEPFLQRDAFVQEGILKQHMHKHLMMLSHF